MEQKNTDYVELIIKAFQGSYGKFVDLVIEHELRGITCEMLDWWWEHMNDGDNYRKWCPRDHISFRVEITKDKQGKPLSIGISKEKIAEYPASDLRMRLIDKDSCPIPIIFGHTNMCSILGTDNEPVGWILHDYKAATDGVKLRSTFRFPEGVPVEFLNAMRNHNLEEMGKLPELLPIIYTK